VRQISKRKGERGKDIYMSAFMHTKARARVCVYACCLANFFSSINSVFSPDKGGGSDTTTRRITHAAFPAR